MHVASPQCRCKQCLLATSAALCELRDALVELSIALKDWQFEADHELRAAAEKAARHLLAKIAVSQNPSRSQDW
jgi:hypothetical protein